MMLLKCCFPSEPGTHQCQCSAALFPLAVAHREKRGRKGTGSSKGGTGSTFPSPWDAAPSIHVSQCPGWCLLGDSWVFRCRKETEVCCHCRIPWESQRSLCWVSAQAALPACVYPRAGKACPMERTKCTGVGHTWRPLAVLLPGEGGPSSHQSRLILHGSFLLLTAAAAENARFLFVPGWL